MHGHFASTNMPTELGQLCALTVYRVLFSKEQAHRILFACVHDVSFTKATLIALAFYS
jgi:hypothetical protein